MSLNARRALDPRWITHHRMVPEGFMIHPITIYRQASGTPQWDPATGTVTGGELVPLWSGNARIQPNKDWRARTVEAGVDMQVVQYTRVQIPLRKQGVVPTVKPFDVIAASDKADTEDWVFNHDLDAWTLYVRNPENSSNRWVYNILCGSDLSDIDLTLGGAP